MNLSLDSGNPPRPFRHFRLAEHCTPGRSFESSPRFWSIGSINGFRLHQLCRPVFNRDAKEKLRRLQEREARIYKKNDSAGFAGVTFQYFIECAGEAVGILAIV